MTRAINDGKPYAGNRQVRFGGGDVVLARPGRGTLHDKLLSKMSRVAILTAMMVIAPFCADAASTKTPSCDHVWKPHATSLEFRSDIKSNIRYKNGDDVEGNVCIDEEQGASLLVAGSNAIARITIDEYRSHYAYQSYEAKIYEKDAFKYVTDGIDDVTKRLTELVGGEEALDERLKQALGESKWEEYQKYQDLIGGYGGFSPVTEDYTLYKGCFRHKLKRIIITGFAAGELISDFSSILSNGYDLDVETRDLYALSSTPTLVDTTGYYLYDIIRSIGKKQAEDEQVQEVMGSYPIREDNYIRGMLFPVYSLDGAPPRFISPAKQDLVFIYNLSPVSYGDSKGKGNDIYNVDTVDVPYYGTTDGLARNGNKFPASFLLQLQKSFDLKQTGKEGQVEIELPMIFPAGTGYHGVYYWTVTVVYEEEGERYRNFWAWDNEEETKEWLTHGWWSPEHGWYEVDIEDGVYFDLDGDEHDPNLEKKPYGPVELVGAADKDDLGDRHLRGATHKSNSNEWEHPADWEMVCDKEGFMSLLLVTNKLGWVFFDKYGQDDAGKPNWFTYWKEDGACPSLKDTDLTIKLDATGCYGEFRSVGEIALNVKVAAEMHYPNGPRIVSSPQHPEYEFSGPHIWGIYTLEEVVAHELSHAKSILPYEDYRKRVCDMYMKHGGTADKFENFWKHLDHDFHKPEKSWRACDIKVEDAEHMQSRLTCAEKDYCDFLFDNQETEKKYKDYGFDIESTDTYGIGKKYGEMSVSKRESEYVAFGDNEFLSMMAANNVTTNDWRAVLTNDWASPGEQSWIPSRVLYARYDFKGGWNPPEKRQNSARQANPSISISPVEANNTQQAFQSSMETMNNGQTGSGMGTVSPSILVADMSKDSEYDKDDERLVAVCYRFSMSVEGREEIHLNGVMTDREGYEVAYADAVVSNGVSEAELRFQCKDIYESRRTGPFRLDRISFVEFDGIEYSKLATLSEFKDAEVEVRREDLARNDAYLLDVVSEAVTTNGIEVSVDMEVSAAGEYGLVATLVNTNGTPVASCSVSASCVQGTNRVNVIFEASEIQRSGVDGPYNIDNIALYKDGERVDSRLHFYSLRKKYQSQAFDFDEDANFDSTQFMAQFDDYTPPAEVPPPERFWVFFNPNGGSVSETSREVKDGDKVGTLPIPTLENDEFLGWYTELEGGTRITDSTIVTTNMMCHARWKNGGAPDPVPTQQAWTVTFNANGGSVSPATRQVAGGSAVGTLPTATRSGYTLVGWFTAASGGTQVSASTKVTANVTYYAHWTQNGGGDGSGGSGDGQGSDQGGGEGTEGGGQGGGQGGGDTPVVAYGLYRAVAGTVSSLVASEYNGYLYKDKEIAGTIQVKVGKPGKDGMAAVKATVIGLDGKKKNLKAAEKGKAPIAANGPTEVVLVGGDPCTVTLGAQGMSGKYGSYDIDGGLNVFMSKEAADKAVAEAVLGRWQGVVNVAWRLAGDGSPYQTLTVTIAAKGKAKVSGTLADGAKVSVSSQMIVGETWCCVPVVYAKKGVSLAFGVWLPRMQGGGALSTVVGLGEDVKVGRPGTLKGGAAFRIDADALAARLGQRVLPYLPNGLPVPVSGGKWTLPKAGKVAYMKGTTEPDEAKLGENPSALKLTYTAKSGTFKGSFKAYVDVNGKPKATTVNVTGVLVDGIGYGAATIKKVGGVPVRIK